MERGLGRIQYVFFIALTIFYTVVGEAMSYESTRHCEALFLQQHDFTQFTSSQADAWEPDQFSDPKHHSEDNFRYIVHAFKIGRRSFLDRLTYFMDPRINLEKKHLLRTASVLSHEHTDTFGSHEKLGGQAKIGIILRIPKELIVAAGSQDLYSDQYFSRRPETLNGATPESLARIAYNEWGLPTPEEVLDGSKQLARENPYAFLKNNEVLFWPGVTENNETIEVTGVFFKPYFSKIVDDDEVPDDVPLKEKLRKIRHWTANNDIPLIHIQDGTDQSDYEKFKSEVLRFYSTKGLGGAWWD